MWKIRCYARARNDPTEYMHYADIDIEHMDHKPCAHVTREATPRKAPLVI